MRFNDEIELNAFVDGELSPAQQAEMLEAMRKDPVLARRACELGQLKAQLRLAYAAPPQPAPHSRPLRRPTLWPGLAAGVALLGIGAVGGWLSHSVEKAAPAQTQRLVMLDPLGLGQAPAVASDDEMRIVFHLTSADQSLAGELLDDIERLLVAYQTDARPLRVEVVSHSDGLDLLREQLSTHAERISGLAGRFSNLTFVACQNTIDRLHVEQGIEVKLVPAAELIESGVNHVVRRQQQGWSYIRV